MTRQHLIEHCEKVIAFNENSDNPIARKRVAEHAILLRFLKGETLADVFPEECDIKDFKKENGE